MEIIFYYLIFNVVWWVNVLEKVFLYVCVCEWKVGDNNFVDYVFVWQFLVEMLVGRCLKVVFVLGVGVDVILSKLNVYLEMLDVFIFLFCLEDIGMGL